MPYARLIYARSLKLLLNNTCYVRILTEKSMESELYILVEMSMTSIQFLVMQCGCEYFLTIQIIYKQKSMGKACKQTKGQEISKSALRS